MLRGFLVMFSFLALSASALGAAHSSDLRSVRGVKYPSSLEEGVSPVVTSVLSLAGNSEPEGFTDLLPFALRSPDQDEAGSCLYMSLTGIAEWWMAKLNPRALRTPDGPIDLSERYLMNVAGVEEDQNGIANWKTDSVYLFNKVGGTILNIDYRFTKNWFTEDKDGNYLAATESTPGATYGAEYNWIDFRNTVVDAPKVNLPKFTREVLFADPESNQWNTGVMPQNIAEVVKQKLVENKAPVHIIYNHFGYWHATVILGFNDEQDNKDCKFVRDFLSYMPRRANELKELAAKAKDPAERERLLRSVAKTERMANQAQRAFTEGGGCHTKGAFYVRDSIYGDANGPTYDYDPTRSGEEAPYVKTTVLLEYDWLRTMANHATQISIE